MWEHSTSAQPTMLIMMHADGWLSRDRQVRLAFCASKNAMIFLYSEAWCSFRKKYMLTANNCSWWCRPAGPRPDVYFSSWNLLQKTWQRVLNWLATIRHTHVMSTPSKFNWTCQCRGKIKCNVTCCPRSKIHAQLIDESTRQPSHSGRHYEEAAKLAKDKRHHSPVI